MNRSRLASPIALPLGAPLLAEIPAGRDEVIIATRLLVNPAMHAA